MACVVQGSYGSAFPKSVKNLTRSRKTPRPQIPCCAQSRIDKNGYSQKRGQEGVNANGIELWMPSLIISGSTFSGSGYVNFPVGSSVAGVLRRSKLSRGYVSSGDILTCCKIRHVRPSQNALSRPIGSQIVYSEELRRQFKHAIE